MNIWRSLSGTVKIEVKSGNISAFLSALQEQGIILRDIRYIDLLTVHCSIRRQDHTAIEAMCNKWGNTVRILSRSGVYWPLVSLRNRPVLFFGMLLLLFLTLFLPTRILFVSVSGNANVADAQIIEAADQCGIRFFASREKVRSEKVKNMLLTVIPELKWAGVNTYGCNAVISVQERSDIQCKPTTGKISHVISGVDGIVRKMTVYRGNPLCRTGQAVRRGQMLVSGYADLGICVKATGAEAEIFAETERVSDAYAMANCIQRGTVKSEKTHYSLKIGKKLIKLWKDSGISDVTCVRIHEEKYLSLPGGFRLPVSIVTEKEISYETAPQIISDPACFLWMQDANRNYICSQMISGNIEEETDRSMLSEGFCRLYSTFRCNEMISRIKYEEIVEADG